MAIELDNRTKILAGVVVLAAVGAGAWFFFLEDFLREPPPKPAAAKSAPAGAPKQADAAKPAADAPKQAPDDAKQVTAATAPPPGAKPIPTNLDKLIAEVIETSGVNAYYRTLGREVMLRAGGGNEARKQRTKPADYQATVEIVNRVFEPAAMTAEIAANLKTGIRADADEHDDRAPEVARDYCGGRTPSFVTCTRTAVILPSAATFAATKAYAPTTKSERSPACEVTIGMSAGTTTRCAPSL